MSTIQIQDFKAFKIGLCQLKSSSDKQANLQNAHEKVLAAAKAGAQMVVLPECFNSPYGTQYFAQYAETIEPPQESVQALSQMAREAKVCLIGGSIPESSEGKYYNTCVIFDQEGKIIGKHRKIHLFDIDVPGKIRFQESEVLAAGSDLTLVQTPFGKIGVAICYDVRFPELAMMASRRGACAMIYPGAFNLHTGPLHWHLLARARAVDNQMYVALCSPARDMSATYNAFGHSLVVDPNGVVVKELGEEPGSFHVDIDPNVLSSVRQGVPVTTQRRFDLYPEIK